MRKHKIFISSVQKEFGKERIALKDFVNRDPLCRRYFEVFLFEDMPACDRYPDSVYLKEVRDCDVYICLLGKEYGTQNINGISSVEREFDEATQCGKERLLFIKMGDDGNRHQKTVKFMKKAGGEMIRRRFSNISDLIFQVNAALVQYLEDEGMLQAAPFDAAVCHGARFSDIDGEYVATFIEAARAERKFPLSQNTTAKKLFAHLNLITDSKISNAAILLFCRNPQKFRHLMCAKIKCMHYHTTKVRKPIPSYQIYKGMLFEQVDEAVDFVMGKLDRSVVPSSAAIASDIVYEIPKMVIREAIVNAVAHRDYTSKVSIQVMLFSDRLEIWNPGALPAGMTMKSLRIEHSSEPHNPLISEPLFWARYIECAGTGTLDMIALCREVGLPEPQFEQRGGQFVITIRRKKALRRQTAKAQVEAQEAQVEAQVTLLKWQQDILSACITGAQSGKELLCVAGYQKRSGNFKRGFQRLLDYELIVHTIPDKPNSRLQRYRLTKKGERYLKGMKR